MRATYGGKRLGKHRTSHQGRVTLLRWWTCVGSAVVTGGGGSVQPRRPALPGKCYPFPPPPSEKVRIIGNILKKIKQTMMQDPPKPNLTGEETIDKPTGLGAFYFQGRSNLIITTLKIGNNDLCLKLVVKIGNFFDNYPIGGLPRGESTQVYRRTLNINTTC